MKTAIKLGLTLVLLFSFSVSYAENMIMLRVNNSYDHVMIALKDKLVEYSYKVAHIQKCDGGLHSMGYESDDYKVVFFGKLKEVRYLSEKYPQIIPFVPLKVAVIKEADSVVLVALNPSSLTPYFKEKELSTQFRRWENDIRAIFNEISEENNVTTLSD